MGKNLIVFQVSEEEKLKYLKESFKKLNEEEENYFKSNLCELESLPTVI